METTRRFNGLHRTAVALIALLGCGSPAKPASPTTPPTSPTPTPITQGFTQDEYNNRIDEVRTAAHAAPLIFVGTMTAIGPAPGVWSGHIPARQPVTYSNVRVLKGSHREASATVHHPVVHGAITADSTAPKLSPAMFAAGKTAIVFADYEQGGLVVADAQVGAIPHDGDNEAAVLQFLPPRP